MVIDGCCPYGRAHDLPRGHLTQELWVTECKQLGGQPSGKDVCRYDPFAERMAQWRRLVSEGKATKEGAEMDCRNYVKQARQHPIPGPEIAENTCKL